jgi:hypothetical protein
MIWTIILVVVIFLIYNGYKGNNDIKNVEKFGGLENKYNILIKNIMSNEKLKLRKINSNNLEIGYSFIGNGYVYFKLIEMDKYLQVKYESKNMVDGIQRLVWKFNEEENQNEMFERISKDLAIHNLMLGGISKQEALEIFNDMTK